jgi:hypothetical protein
MARQREIEPEPHPNKKIFKILGILGCCSVAPNTGFGIIQEFQRETSFP